MKDLRTFNKFTTQFNIIYDINIHEKRTLHVFTLNSFLHKLSEILYFTSYFFANKRPQKIATIIKRVQALAG